MNPFPDGVCGRGFFSPEDSSADTTIRTAAHCLRMYERSLVRCLLANPREARQMRQHKKRQYFKC